MPKKIVIADQKKRKELTESWLISQRIGVLILVPVILICSMIFLYNVRYNILLLIISFIIFIWSFISCIYFLFYKKHMKYEVCSIYFFRIVSNTIGVMFMYLLLCLLAYLIPTMNEMDIDFNYLSRNAHIFLFFYGLILYSLFNYSWRGNFMANAQILLKDKPYIRLISQKTPMKEGNYGNIRAGISCPMMPEAYCVLFPYILTEKALDIRKENYEYGGRIVRAWHVLLRIVVLGSAGPLTLMWPSKKQTFLPILAFLFLLFCFYITLKNLVTYQKLRQIEKKEGITFLPYFMKPQEEVDAENEIVET